MRKPIQIDKSGLITVSQRNFPKHKEIISNQITPPSSKTFESPPDHDKNQAAVFSPKFPAAPIDRSARSSAILYPHRFSPPNRWLLASRHADRAAPTPLRCFAETRVVLDEKTISFSSLPRGSWIQTKRPEIRRRPWGTRLSAAVAAVVRLCS